MQVSKQTAFAPVNVTITFESEKEYTEFKSLMAHSITVPKSIYEHVRPERRNLMADMMSHITRYL